MDTEKAAQFAAAWIKSWNDHDVEAILSHYTDEIVFYSPFISLLQFNETGQITGKSELKRYFEKGLNGFPDLYFELHNYFIGFNTLVITYTSVRGKLAAEVFEFNDDGKAVKVYCNYASNKQMKITSDQERQ